MSHAESRNKIRERTARIFWAAASGLVVGAGLGAVERLVTGKPVIRTRAADLMLLGGAYAATDIILKDYKMSPTYKPVVAGCVAGIVSSRSGVGLVVNSVAASALGIALNKPNIWIRE
ncbi:hypothetical protein NEHOM01_2387 [Nematocida homosporus]|uniref:uncharacterized protein n=1 Tax=Nematocida homosporus TaxID=1912981 RepID=UPI00221FF414|nr:uncharacterized protein NEHOM01_2387 [Nematocida homosporus]KAI5187814.1 hypothetical protein NEHOM01_2387 [Nematocida homosporus]